MQNPWESLPEAAPFILDTDRETLSQRLSRITGDYSLRLDLRPQPYTGCPQTAQVILLALNPGFSTDDIIELENPDYADQWAQALTFETRTPFYFLDPAFTHTAGYAWWFRRFRDLISECGLEPVKNQIACVELFPYKSKSYRPVGVTLPSQLYSFHLVREAMNQGKEIVVMRSERAWLDAIPELQSYNYIKLSNHQNPYLSRNQMSSDQFARLMRRLRPA
jgi:hypothetical protein